VAIERRRDVDALIDLLLGGLLAAPCTSIST